jgi:hypothetical protein
MYQVLENGQPADCEHRRVDSFWAKSSYNDFDDAKAYLQKWMGLDAQSVNWDKVIVGKKIRYKKYTMEIKEISCT